MRITKFGHSCLLIEEGSARILIDPGSYSTLQNEVKNIDAIFITHEHQDHLNLDSIKSIRTNSPEAKIYTNQGVSQKLNEAGIAHELLLGGQRVEVKGVNIEGYGEWHAVIHPAMPRVYNVGYRIAERFYYGGDVLEVPNASVEILAYPALAPWMKASEAIEYAKQIKPKVVFPVHDAFLKFPGPFYMLPEKLLSEAGIKWQVIEPGATVEF